MTRNHAPWTEPEREALIALIAKNVRFLDMHLRGRTAKACENQASLLRRAGRIPSGYRKPEKKPAPVRAPKVPASAIDWPAIVPIIQQMRDDGKTWAQIGEVVGVNGKYLPNAARLHGVIEASRQDVPAEPVRPDNQPLPAGHPASWDLINRGMSIEGASFYGVNK